MSAQQNIEVIARGLLRHGRFVLTCRDVSRCYLSLPGGHVDRGETIRRACEREFLEETGLSVVAGPCLAVADVAFVQDGSPVQEVTIVFHVEPRDNSIVGDDTPNAVASLEPKIAFEWVEVGELKRRDLRPACVKDWVEALSARPLSDATATTFLEQHDPPRRST